MTDFRRREEDDEELVDVAIKVVKPSPIKCLGSYADAVKSKLPSDKD